MSQTTCLSTSGRFLLDPQGLRIILRGINMQTWDDPNFPATNSTRSLEWADANAVRIQWYADYTVSGSRSAQLPISDLVGVLNDCRQHALIPVVMLADLTQTPDRVDLINSKLVPWWIDNKAALLPFSERLIINIANEAGVDRWSGDPNALNSYVQVYKQAITSLRSAGYLVPLMIDAPDGGSTLDAFLKIGQELIDADPIHNILLSCHAYWAAYDGMPLIPQTITANLPIVFGEVANWQDEATPCVYSLDGSNQGTPAGNGFTYQQLLTVCQQNLMGWLAWSWGPDDCTPRNITQTLAYPPQWTPYGNDLVNNTVYGLSQAAPNYGRW